MPSVSVNQATFRAAAGGGPDAVLVLPHARVDFELHALCGKADDSLDDVVDIPAENRVRGRLVSLDIGQPHDRAARQREGDREIVFGRDRQAERLGVEVAGAGPVAGQYEADRHGCGERLHDGFSPSGTAVTAAWLAIDSARTSV